MPLPEARDFQDWGPYLSYGRDASTEMVVSWTTRAPAREAWVQFGETPRCTQALRQTHETPQAHFTFPLAQLRPETRYYYRISRDAGRNTYWFRTGTVPGATPAAAAAAPAPAPVEFCVLGDIHSDHRDVRPGYRAMDRYAPDAAFVLTVGDSINDGASEASWRDFFYQTTPFLWDRPWMNATGNHDTDSPAKYQRFLAAWDHPYVAPARGAYYSFDDGIVHVVVLDSNNAGTWEPTPSDAQFEWLAADLQAHARGETWVVVCLHHQIYSTGDFACARVMHEWLRPVFDEYHVDMVFYGHDHHFEIFHVAREAPWGGTHYVVTGGGGSNLDWSIMDPNKQRAHSPRQGPRYLWRSDTHVAAREFYDGGDVDNVEGFRNDEIVQKYQEFGILRHHFTHVAIAGDHARLRAVGWDGEVYFEKTFPRTRKPAGTPAPGSA